MNVLVIYRRSHHKRSIDNLVNMLSERGVIADALCLDDYSVTINTNKRYLSFITSFWKYLEKVRIRKVSGALWRMYKFYVLLTGVIGYNKVDFHSFYPDYNWIMKFCHMLGIKYDISLWGSDVLRASEKDLLKNKTGFKSCTCIRGIDVLFKKVSSFYDGEFDHKFVYTDFGDNNLSLINSMAGKDTTSQTEALFGEESRNKLIVTCGYNGREGQQHKLIIDALARLSDDRKSKIHVIVPMTYDANDDYVAEIREQLNQTSISFKILTDFLAPEDLVLLRLKSNITVNMQITDAMCSAIIEHLYCENIVLIADWLDYPLLDNNKIWYLKINHQNVLKVLSSCIDDYYTLLSNKAQNHDRLDKLVSWQAMIDLWVRAFKKGFSTDEDA